MTPAAIRNVIADILKEATTADTEKSVQLLAVADRYLMLLQLSEIK